MAENNLCGEAANSMGSVLNLMNKDTYYYNNIVKSSEKMSQSMGKLASGMRVMSAADDPSGIAISMNIESTLRGFSTVLENIQEGINLLQTADDAVGHMIDLHIKVEEISIKGINSSADKNRKYTLVLEIYGLKSQAYKTAQTTVFNTKELLNGAFEQSQGGQPLQVGPNGDKLINQINAVIPNLTDTAKYGGMPEPNPPIDPNAITIQTFVDHLEQTSGTYIPNLIVARGDIGALIERLKFIIEDIWKEQEGLAETKGRIVDADFSTEVLNFYKSKVINYMGTYTSILGQPQPETVAGFLRRSNERNSMLV